jgi:hypothetical protein
VDQRLHRGQQQRCAEPAEDRPEDDDRAQVLREDHGQRTDRISEQTERVRPLAADQVADLAADQDERRGHECLERDRRLDPADGRTQVLNHGRDRHVHQGRIDHEDEHRHRDEDREARVARALLGSDGAGLSGQGTSSPRPA